MSFDAVRFLTDNHIEYQTDGKNIGRGWVGVECPDCHTNHGGFKLSDGRWNCWRCGGKSTIDIVMALLKISFPQAAGLVKDYSGEGIGLRPEHKEKAVRMVSIEMPGDPLGDRHRRYLEKRNFDPDYLVNKYKVMGTSIAGDWKLRIMVPILFKGRLVCFQGRDITNKQKERYKTLAKEKSVIPAKNILYNLDNCSFSKPIFVFEGVFNCFRWGDGSCATFGTSMTEEQVKWLSYYKNIFFLFDPEKEAQMLARKSALKLSALGCKVELINIEGENDVADLSDKEVLKIKRELL